eukprot:768349-Hanusia_phi.AAC.8
MLSFTCDGSSFGIAMNHEVPQVVKSFQDMPDSRISVPSTILEINGVSTANKNLLEVWEELNDHAKNSLNLLLLDQHGRNYSVSSNNRQIQSCESLNPMPVQEAKINEILSCHKPFSTPPDNYQQPQEHLPHQDDMPTARRKQSQDQTKKIDVFDTESNISKLRIMFELLYCNAGRRSAKIADDCVVDDMIGDSFENIAGYNLISVNDIQVKGKEFDSIVPLIMGVPGSVVTLKFARHGNADQRHPDVTSAESDLNPQRPMTRTIHYYRGMSSNNISQTSPLESSDHSMHGKPGFGYSPLRVPLSAFNDNKGNQSLLPVSAAKKKASWLGSGISHFYEVRNQKQEELRAKAVDLKNRLRQSGLLLGNVTDDAEVDFNWETESTSSEPCTPRSFVDHEMIEAKGDHEIADMLGKLYLTCNDLDDLTSSLQSAVYEYSFGSLRQSADKNFQTDPNDDELSE